MSYNLSKYERETIINFNEEEKMASIYTCSEAYKKKLDNFCKKRPDLYKLEEDDPPSKTYIFPKRLISIRLPRILTEEQKDRLTEVGRRLGLARQSKIA